MIDNSDVQTIAEQTRADGFAIQDVLHVEFRWGQAKCWQSIVSGVAIWSGVHFDHIEVWSERVMRTGTVEPLVRMLGEKEMGIYTLRHEMNLIIRRHLKPWEFMA